MYSFSVFSLLDFKVWKQYVNIVTSLNLSPFPVSLCRGKYYQFYVSFFQSLFCYHRNFNLVENENTMDSGIVFQVADWLRLCCDLLDIWSWGRPPLGWFSYRDAIRTLEKNCSGQTALSKGKPTFFPFSVRLSVLFPKKRKFRLVLSMLKLCMTNVCLTSVIGFFQVSEPSLRLVQAKKGNDLLCYRTVWGTRCLKKKDLSLHSWVCFHFCWFDSHVDSSFMAVGLWPITSLLKICIRNFGIVFHWPGLMGLNHINTFGPACGQLHHSYKNMAMENLCFIILY
jgi:hypothetical protein